MSNNDLVVCEWLVRRPGRATHTGTGTRKKNVLSEAEFSKQQIKHRLKQNPDTSTKLCPLGYSIVGNVISKTSVKYCKNVPERERGGKKI
jgi:hypothetical protein